MSQDPSNNKFDLVDFRIVSPQEYQANLRRVEEAQAQLDHYRAMNEAAKEAYDKEQDLLRKIREGKEAEFQLQSLMAATGSAVPAVEGPSNQFKARMEQPYHSRMGANTQQPYTAGVPISQKASYYRTTTSFPSTSSQQTQPLAPPRSHKQSQHRPAAQAESHHLSRPPLTVSEGRHPLPMQPVPQPSQSASAHTTSNSVQRRDAGNYSVQSPIDGVASSVVSTVAAQTFRTTPASESSLAGALDLSRNTKSSLHGPAAENESHPSTAVKNDGPSSKTNPAPSAKNSGTVQESSDDHTAAWRRFCNAVQMWAETAPAPSSMPLSNTGIKVIKDSHSQVFVTIPPNNSGGLITMSLQDLLAKVLDLETRGSIPAERPQPPAPVSIEYRPYSVPPHQQSQPPSYAPKQTVPVVNASSSTPVTSSTTFESSARTPSQADKKSLAKDILRALSDTSLKRSQPDHGSEDEPPAKRQASAMSTEPRQNLTKPSFDSTATTQSTSVPVSSSPSVQYVSMVPEMFSTPQEALSAHLNREKRKAAQAGPSNPSFYVSQSGLLPSSKVGEATATIPVSKERSDLPKTVSPTIDENQRGNEIRPTPSFSAPRNASSAPPSPPSNEDNNTSSVDRHLVPPSPPTPLFLPSPSSSPSLVTSGGLASNVDRSQRRELKTSHRAYVLIPSPPRWLQEYKTQRSKGKQRSFKIFTDVEATASNSSDEVEREAVLLSCSRIRHCPCKWNGCDAVLSSVEKLIRHFAFAHQEMFHVRSHVFVVGKVVVGMRHIARKSSSMSSLMQSYLYDARIKVSCDKLFLRPRELSHHVAEHTNVALKPPALPYSPESIAPPPEASSNIIPSFLLDPVRSASLSKERHAKLARWTLLQIAGPVSKEVKRYNLASKVQQSPSHSDQRGYQPYDFLCFPSTNHSSAPSLPSRIRGMQDLLSAEVTEIVQNGLLLWTSQEEEEESSEDELLPSSPSSPIPQPLSNEDNSLPLNSPMKEEKSSEDGLPKS
ncbi:hypothetical protein H0H93_006750 [Arthromyces matolae]|nr:hypothetical protein H0H93_006750 [Arthromyces matolae]